MNEAVKRGLGLLFGLLAIFALFFFAMAELRTQSNPIWVNIAIGIGALGVAIIIGKVMYHSLRSSLRS